LVYPHSMRVYWRRSYIKGEVMQNTLKTVGKTDEELRVANYIIMFGGRDLDGETFIPETEVESPYTKSGLLRVDFEHGMDVLEKDEILGHVDWKTAKKDERGWFVERVLDRRNQYVQWLEELIEADLIGNSSEATKSAVIEDGLIKKWPLKRDTLTVVPAEPRMLTENQIHAIKSLSDRLPYLKSLLPEDAQESVREGEGEGEVDNVNVKIINKEISQMTEEIKSEILEPEVEEIDLTEGIKEALSETRGQVKSLADQVAALVDRMEHEPKYRDGGYYSPVGGTSDQKAKSFGDFVLSVYRNDHDRLTKVYKTAMGEQSGALGGYLVPEEFHNLLVEVAPMNVPFRERANVIPVMSDAGKVPALDQQTTVTAGSGNTSFSGGVNGGWVAEGSAGSETNANLKQIEYNVKKISAYTSVSNELLADSAQSVDSLLARLFGRAVNSLEEHAFIRGSGAGAPLGLLNAAAAIGVNPDTNSAFSLPDATEMLSRFYPMGGSPMWIAHRSIIPDLGAYFDVATGGVDWVQPREGLPGSLLGYDLFWSEHMPQANYDNPLLVDLACYYIFDRSPLALAFSEHSAFTSDQGQFRITKRLDGQPGIQSYITLADPQGSYTVSPIVYFND